MKQSKKSSQTTHSVFKQAFLTGLTAPSLLISGVFSGLPVRHISTLDDAWSDVGHLIRSNAETYRLSNVRKK